jgi:hypothetical protein
VSGVRGRRLTAIVAAALLALVAGCGGGDDVAPEVPGAPADFVVPETTVQAAGDEEAATTDEDATTDETAPEDTTGGATEETAPSTDQGAAAPEESTGGGTAAPETQADGPTNDTAPPAGSEAEQFEDFCAQNPGAC